ncbi:rRNA methyltransferase 1 [Colletotrichum trifolii]|uniref:rRNA methyltransferase 1, mitochondrial n=1 Tax=Colletotrichum trifolii TaxID=5466 RepID=A0A4V3HUS8_COLTR|nr:rRNA methyltransferase 1 [Colletotrichum trifolii]
MTTLELPNTLGHVRNAQLSAIHRGIRRSERAGPEHGRTSRFNSKPRMNDRRDQRRPRQTSEPETDAFTDKFKGAIGGGREHHFKPKKAFQKMQEREERDEEGGRKSRSKRFNNPEYSFGKKSLVYQLNRGELKDKVSKLLDKDGSHYANANAPPPGSAWSRNFGSGFSRSGGNASRNDSGSPRFGGRREDSKRPALDGPRDFNRDDKFRRPARDSARRDSTRFTKDSVRRELQDDRGPPSRQPRELAVSIHYTTAASQFLFGRSVVAAALNSSRRKFYNLYVYRSDNKKDTQDDRWIVSMAEKKGVKVNPIDFADQKLMDKKSKGRPHNGVVLEASPLPQLPLTGLGALSVSKDFSGYPVSVAHQSREAAAINGINDFIPCRPGSARPLVLLLHEILDPGNLGAILRTARFFGVSAVAITERTSSAITSTVLKAAAGAAEELKLFSVNDPVAFLEASQDAGWTSYAAVAPAHRPRGSRQLTTDAIETVNPLASKPCILVLGNEGGGLPSEVRRKASQEITIPRMPATSSVDSLNVSVAAALLCNSFLRGTRQQEPLNLTDKLRIEGQKPTSGETLF